MILWVTHLLPASEKTEDGNAEENRALVWQQKTGLRSCLGRVTQGSVTVRVGTTPRSHTCYSVLKYIRVGVSCAPNCASDRLTQLGTAGPEGHAA